MRNLISSITTSNGIKMCKLFSKLILFSLFFRSDLNPVYSEKWDENITTKVEVRTFWNRVKETREIKYGKDPNWDKNFDFCSDWSNNIAISKGEGYVMSNLIRYTHKCLNTLDFMTKYVLEEE